MVHSIATAEELTTELTAEKNKGKLIVMDFFATWCGPCLRIAPTIETWSKEDFKDSATFLKCDVDQAEDVAQEYSIEAMPTFVFIKDGKEVHRLVGANVNKLKADIENQVKKTTEDDKESKNEAAETTDQADEKKEEKAD